jgi:hypothetical protein
MGMGVGVNVDAVPHKITLFAEFEVTTVAKSIYSWQEPFMLVLGSWRVGCRLQSGNNS